MDQKHKPLDRAGYVKRFSFKDAELPDGSIVRIRALPASYLVDGPEERFSPERLLTSSLCDENGALIFAENEGEKAMSVDGVSLRIIMDAIMELNALKRNADEEAGDAEKN